MHENINEQKNEIEPFYKCNEISTYLEYCLQTKNHKIIRKYKPSINICKSLITLKEINDSIHILKIRSLLSENELIVVQNFDNFVPLKLFLTENSKFDYIPFILNNILKICQENQLVNEISEFLDPEILWINHDYQIKICWFTFVIKYQKYFDNSIHKINLNHITGIINLFNLNKKRLIKRLSKNITDTRKEQENKFYDLGENFFTYKSNIKVKHNMDITYSNNKNIDDDKESIRVYGSKKLCVVNTKLFDMTEKKSKSNINFFGIRLLILKIIFHKEIVELRNIELYISKVKEMLTTNYSNSFTLTNKLRDVLNILISENIDEPIEMKNDFKENIDNDKMNYLINKIKKYESDDLIVNKTNTKYETVHDIFVERGFNMADFDTKTYQKGRFYVCQAVPNTNIKDNKKDIDLNKIYQLIEIQNKQIEMMYQTLKEKNNIDKLIDDQLECLSLQANNMLSELDKKETQ